MTWSYSTEDLWKSSSSPHDMWRADCPWSDQRWWISLSLRCCRDKHTLWIWWGYTRKIKSQPSYRFLKFHGSCSSISQFNIVDMSLDRRWVAIVFKFKISISSFHTHSCDILSQTIADQIVYMTGRLCVDMAILAHQSSHWISWDNKHNSAGARYPQLQTPCFRQAARIKYK